MRVIEGGDREFGLLAFGVPSQRTINFLESQVYNLPDTLTSAGRAFMERGKEIFERYNGSEAIRFAKAAVRHIQHAFMPDAIRPLTTIGAIQQAPLSMQRWIMASPFIREQYHMQRCDGYSETYTDLFPGVRGEDHYDYRRVMNGVLQECTEEEDADWKAVNYYDTEDDIDLSLSEQTDILSVWDLCQSMMGAGKEDPTSPFCSRL